MSVWECIGVEEVSEPSVFAVGLYIWDTINVTKQLLLHAVTAKISIAEL